MAKATRGSERRHDALSRERIVAAAIELLDKSGENDLTFCALATRLATRPGAISWHVANKSELLVAATDAVVARTLGDSDASAASRDDAAQLPKHADCAEYLAGIELILAGIAASR
jgi:AcrR family transcriptional regulator